jgi:uncharacterized membrane protein YphA (DoxX/SURF4 family)
MTFTINERHHMNSTALVIGRIFVALLFVNGGIAHFTKLGAMAGYAQYKKVPAAKLSVILSGLMILVGGFSVLLGVYVDLGSLLLAAFLIISALIFHDFWKETDATAKQNASTAFFKNISLAGFSLILFGLVAKHGDITIGWHIGHHVALFTK